MNMPKENTLRIATYNLRYENKKDTGNLWVDRSPVLINLIRFHDFDILGTQEGLKNQLDDVNTSLPYYERYGIARDDGKDKGEHCAIFFKRERFEMTDKGDFWLSDTPDQPGYGWDAIHNRICTWVKLKDKLAGSSFFVFNAHLDHDGVKARNESSTLLLRKSREIAGNSTTVLLGDFNGDHGTEWYKTIVNSGHFRDSYKSVQHPYANNGSFNSWGQDDAANRIIDHIFITKDIEVLKYGILTDTYYSRPPSDHFPVMADLVLKES
jgi:endonuclease/exonuclease/phosphatase family metal-dependent hydrolase